MRRDARGIDAGVAVQSMDCHGHLRGKAGGIDRHHLSEEMALDVALQLVGRQVCRCRRHVGRRRGELGADGLAGRLPDVQEAAAEKGRGNQPECAGGADGSSL